MWRLILHLIVPAVVAVQLDAVLRGKLMRPACGFRPKPSDRRASGPWVLADRQHGATASWPLRHRLANAVAMKADTIACHFGRLRPRRCA